MCRVSNRARIASPKADAADTAPPESRPSTAQGTVCAGFVAWAEGRTRGVMARLGHSVGSAICWLGILSRCNGQWCATVSGKCSRPTDTRDARGWIYREDRRKPRPSCLLSSLQEAVGREHLPAATDGGARRCRELFPTYDARAVTMPARPTHNGKRQKKTRQRRVKGARERKRFRIERLRVADARGYRASQGEAQRAR